MAWAGKARKERNVYDDDEVTNITDEKKRVSREKAEVYLGLNGNGNGSQEVAAP